MNKNDFYTASDSNHFAAKQPQLRLTKAAITTALKLAAVVPIPGDHYPIHNMFLEFSSYSVEREVSDLNPIEKSK